MIDPAAVSAVLVTRGNQPTLDIFMSIRDAGIKDVLIWDNSLFQDLSCYARYAAIEYAKNEWIYQQDDDLIAPVAALLAEFDPVSDRDTIVANNDEAESWRLTGRGVIFHRSLADCFGPYLAAHGNGKEFHRVADIVFAYQHPYRTVDLGWQDLPWASDPAASMYLEPGHYEVRERARARVAALLKEA